MYIEPEGNNVQSERLLVEASNDGKTYRKVRQLVPPRQGWQNTGYGYTYFLPSTTARFFRFSWTPDGTEPGSEDLDAAKWKALLKLRNITLSNEERIDNYEGKAAYVWRIDADSSSCQSSLSETRQAQNISSHFSTGGGKVVGFRILRIGHTSTGQMNATAGGGKGLEVDKFSSSTTQKLLNGWFLKFLSRPHSSVVKYLHVDSWECGSQNNFVTADMVKEGAVVIDVGTTRVPDPTKKKGFHLNGDVKFDEVAPKCSYITPVPGGVGPMTICSLMKNTLAAAKKEYYK